MYRRQRGYHAPIAFIGYQAKCPSIHHTEIDSGYADISRQEYLSKYTAGSCNHFRYVFGIRCAKFLVKELPHLGPGQVDGRGDDMAGAFSAQLDDIFAQVCFDDLQSGWLERMVEINFLRNHGFRLGYQPGIVLPGDLKEDADGFFFIGGAMNPDAIVSDLGYEASKIFIQVCDHVGFDGVGTRAALLEIGDRGDSLQAADQPAFGIPIQSKLQVLIRQGLADAGAKCLCTHWLSKTCA